MKTVKRGKMFKTLALIMAAAIGMPGALSVGGRQTEAAEALKSSTLKEADKGGGESVGKPELTLWYDEPARATFGEVYAKKYWISNVSVNGIEQGDGFLELGRSDGANYKDGKNHSKDLTMENLEECGVTDAVWNGVSWAKHALPVGNGHMGAMSFGYTDTERVQMNEDTLWTGGPNYKREEGNTGDAYGNVTLDDPAAAMKSLVDNAFTEFYTSLQTGKMPQAGKDSKTGEYDKSSPFLNGFTPNSKAQEGAYQSFAEMYLDFNMEEAKAENYKRYLNLDTAVSGVTYTYEGVNYNRKLFASYPDDVLVYRIDASENGKVSFTLRPEIPNKEPFKGRYNSTSNDGTFSGKEGSVIANGDTITLKGSLKHNGMKFLGQYKVVAEGGTMKAENEDIVTNSPDNGSITVTGADSAYIIVSLTTDYAADFDKNYSTGESLEQLETRMEEKVEAAAALGYEKLYENHEADYRELFSRVELNLGGGCYAGCADR